MNEMEHVGEFVFASLCNGCNFFGAFLLPEKFIFHFEELPEFFEFSCFSIEDGINFVYWVGDWICF